MPLETTFAGFKKHCANVVGKTQNLPQLIVALEMLKFEVQINIMQQARMHELTDHDCPDHAKHGGES